MKSFQLILEECVTGLSNDVCTVDECLVRYPQYAKQLKPLLRTVHFLEGGRKLKPSQAFKARSRRYLTQDLRFNPRYSGRMQLSWQTALILLVTLVSTFFVTGTVHAQSVLPGDNFYPWKRVSEEVWRSLSINPVNTDIVLANRRLNEWIAVANDPELSASARNGYRAALSKLESMNDARSLGFIVPVLQAHQRLLNEAGLPTSELDDYLLMAAGLFPVNLPVQATPTEVPTEIAPTEVPTEVPTEIVPDTCALNCGDNVSDNPKDNGTNNGNGINDHNADGHEDNGKGNDKGGGKGNNKGGGK